MTARTTFSNPGRDPARPWAPSPFGRLAQTHALSIAGDAVFTTAMAGLIFFSVTKLDQARWQVGAALLFTIVPFSLAAPFLGPLIDRAKGGRKWMIFGLCLARAAVCFLLVMDRDNQLLMYPQFTLVLVFAQGYVLARGALVPATVHNDEELVEANSKLAAISGVGAVGAGAVSLTVMWVVSKFGSDRGPNVALAIAAVVYLAASVQALQLPAVRIAATPADEFETRELHSSSIVSAATAVSVTRVVVGFITFLLAFYFKNLEDTDIWGSRVGLVGSVIAAQIGFLGGAGLAVKARRAVSEEQMVLGGLVILAIGGFLTSVMGDLAGALLMAFSVGLASNAAKQAFDSIVQRDAPDANRGRAFAKFETRFQLWWVLGALVPVIIPGFSPHLGFLLVALISTGGTAWFFITRRRLLAESRRRPSPLAGEPELVEPRPVSRSFLRGLQSREMAEVPASPSARARGDETEPLRAGFGGDDATVVAPGEGVAFADPSSPDPHATPRPPDPRGPDARQDPNAPSALVGPTASAGHDRGGAPRTSRVGPRTVDADETTIVQGRPDGAEDPTDVWREPPSGSSAPPAPVGPATASGSAEPPPTSPRDAPPRASPSTAPPPWRSSWDGFAHPAPVPTTPAARPVAPAAGVPSRGDDHDDELFGGSDASLLADISRPPESGLFAPTREAAPRRAAALCEPPEAQPSAGSPASGEPRPATMGAARSAGTRDGAGGRPSEVPEAARGSRHDPGPPSLVPPAPVPLPSVRPPSTVPAPVEPGSNDAADDPYAAPDPPQVPLVEADGSYPAIPWRDTVAPLRPGFDDSST